MTRASSCIQEVAARLSKRFRRNCDSSVVTFQLPSSSPSCRDNHTIIVITVLMSCSNHRRHRPVVTILLSSSSPSYRCDHAIIVLTTHGSSSLWSSSPSWLHASDVTCHCHLHASHYCCHPDVRLDTASSLSCRRRLVVVVSSAICNVIAPSLTLLWGIIAVETVVLWYE